MRKIPLREKLTLLSLRSAFRTGSALSPEFTAGQALRYFVTPVRIPRPGWEQEVATHAKRWTMRNGFIAYSWGQGPKVLLVRGWDGRATQMGRIAVALANAGFEAVAIDLPAHGESAGKTTHIVEAKEAILSAGEELGPLEAVIAHSFGACASIYALYHGLDAKKFVDLAGANRFTGIFDRYLDFIHLKGKARDLFREKVEALAGMDAGENYSAVWAKKLDQAALIIHDRDDDDAPFADGEEIHAAWNNSRMLVTEGLGHRRILKSKAVLSSILQFLGAEGEKHDDISTRSEKTSKDPRSLIVSSAG